MRSRAARFRRPTNPGSVSMKLPLALRSIFALALGAILTTTAVSYRHWRTLLDSSAWVLHSHDVRGTLSQLLSGLEAAESAERGFVITRDETYVAPYETARREAPERLRVLRTLVKD